MDLQLFVNHGRFLFGYDSVSNAAASPSAVISELMYERLLRYFGEVVRSLEGKWSGTPK